MSADSGTRCSSSAKLPGSSCFFVVLTAGRTASVRRNHRLSRIAVGRRDPPALGRGPSVGRRNGDALASTATLLRNPRPAVRALAGWPWSGSVRGRAGRDRQRGQVPTTLPISMRRSRESERLNARLPDESRNGFGGSEEGQRKRMRPSASGCRQARGPLPTPAHSIGAHIRKVVPPRLGVRTLSGCRPADQDRGHRTRYSPGISE